MALDEDAVALTGALVEDIRGAAKSLEVTAVPDTGLTPDALAAVVALGPIILADDDINDTKEDAEDLVVAVALRSLLSLDVGCVEGPEAEKEGCASVGMGTAAFFAGGCWKALALRLPSVRC